jgi:hypothetical protein
MRRHASLTSIALAAIFLSSSCADIDDIPSPFRRDIGCMLGVLKATPRVDQVRSGVLDRDGWLHPYVEYRYQELDGRLGTVRFVASKAASSKDKIVYWSYPGGLSTPGVVPPSLDTVEIARHWELQCAVAAMAVFV